LKIRQHIYEKLRDLRWSLIRLRHKKSQKSLALEKQHQKNIFINLSNNFSDYYEKLKQYDISKFVTKPWHIYNTRVEQVFLPAPTFDFLKNPVVMETMFVTRGGKCLKEEIAFLESQLTKEELDRILHEDYVGDPLIFNDNYITSHNRIHNAYHLMYYKNSKNVSFNSINNVVEWGGGYGTMAYIFNCVIKDQLTYTIIDTPLFSCIQWLYLSTILGEDIINFIIDENCEIKENKINILPLCFCDNHDVKADLFLSTWALSESSVASQDYVISRDWFDAKKLLIAYQHSDMNLPDAARVGELAKAKGATNEKISFLPGNYYSFL